MRMWDASSWVGACGVRAGHVIRREGILAVVPVNRGNVLQVMDELGREGPFFPKAWINQEAVRQLLIPRRSTAEPAKPMKEERTRSIVLTGTNR